MEAHVFAHNVRKGIRAQQACILAELLVIFIGHTQRSHVGFDQKTHVSEWHVHRSSYTDHGSTWDRSDQSTANDGMIDDFRSRSEQLDSRLCAKRQADNVRF